MFDRVSKAAEKLANNVSRRAFMGGLGKGALALAGAMGAMLAFPALVRAGGSCVCLNGFLFCCQYADGTTTGGSAACKCKEANHGMPLQAQGCFCNPI
jgi:hypothetical protein